jgi:hypothetical protein
MQIFGRAQFGFMHILIVITMFYEILYFHEILHSGPDYLPGGAASHLRAIYYYLWSIRRPTLFPAFACSRYSRHKKAALGIRDILVPIRTSESLTNRSVVGSGSNSGFDSFLQRLQGCKFFFLSFILQALFLSAQHLYEKREGSGSIPLTNVSGSGSPTLQESIPIRRPSEYPFNRYPPKDSESNCAAPSLSMWFSWSASLGVLYGSSTRYRSPRPHPLPSLLHNVESVIHLPTVFRDGVTGPTPLSNADIL